MGQSRLMSLVESAINVSIGYVVALITQIIVFPIFGLHAKIRDQILIGLIFTAVSIARSYWIRRLFNAIK
jgi:hypothetical protein